MSNELAAALTKFAEADLRYARKYGGHTIARTKQGNVLVGYDATTRLYGVLKESSFVNGEYVDAVVLLSNAKKAEALKMVVSLYNVVSE